MCTEKKHANERQSERMSAEPSLAVGWAQGSITPEQPVNLFGMFNERISTHVEEACLATALALEGRDGEQAIWISCDLVGISRDVVREVRTRVAARIPGFNWTQLRSLSRIRTFSTWMRKVFSARRSLCAHARLNQCSRTEH